MKWNGIARWRRSLEAYFPERHLYVRSGGEVRTFVLTTPRQMMIAGAIGLVGLWTGVSTASMVLGAFTGSRVERAVALERAKSERRIADREARLNSAVAQLSDTNGATEQLADAVEKRLAAVAMLLDGPQSPVLTAAVDADESPEARIQRASAETDRLVNQSEGYAKTRADRLRTALRLAGLNPAEYSGSGAALGGPLIGAQDPAALAEVLDVDEDFARRIQRAAGDMSSIHAMSEKAAALPFGQPTVGTRRSSGFGVRVDPFTRTPAYHSGLDFAGPLRTPIYATGPGVVSYVGPRSGYGTVVEIDHGGGFKTRYAHLSAALVKVGQKVAVGQRIAAMGSSGRSTGSHLHYEVWVNGRAQNPDRFLKAGSYVQQTQ